MTMPILAALLIHWYISLFCQTFFLHRYASHGMFKLPYWLDRFFYLVTFIAQGPSFLNPRAYALLHQAHHKFSDTPSDPHSPHHHESMKDMMLKTFHHYRSLVNNPGHLRDGHYYPTWPLLDSFATTKMHTLMWVGIYLFAYQFLIDSPWQYSFLIIHFFMGPIQGALVNWFGHKWGYRNYSLPDKSRNTMPIDVFLMGEFYQNNHHQHPMSLNFAKKWFEWDPTYPIIWTLRKLRLLKLPL